MKSGLKALLLVLCAIVLVVATVFTTLAFLTDTENEVINTFTVGSVNIKLDETDVGLDGVATGEGRKQEGNEYKLFPGKTYTKDPMITVETGSEKAWVFAKVDNQIAALEAATGDGYTKIAEVMVNNGWTLVDDEANVYVYGNDAQVAGTTCELFEEFKIAGTVDNDTLASAAESKIIINGYAIQADGFETAEEAWDALEAEMNA